MLQNYKWIYFIVLACLLVACQRDDVANDAETMVVAAELSATPSPTCTFTPTATPTATPTLVPTKTAMPTPTPTATPFVCSLPNGQTREGSFFSQALAGEEIRYLVHLPPCYVYSRDRNFPVLYLLHGWPMNEQHWVGLGIERIADEWIVSQLTGPFIAVMPGVVNPYGLYVNSSGGSNSVEGMVVEELVPLIDTNYRTWQAAEGRAIGGISRGGVWSLEIGLRNPDIFGIVGGHSPALSVNHALPAYDPFLLAADGAAGQHIYLSAGDVDWARQSTVQLYDLLVAQEAAVQYQTGEGAHVDRLWKLGLPNYLKFYTESWPRSFDELPLRD
ncbi:MAG: alpha/beta hydrolase-fold protein [Chloroflexota bacterium]|nr:alpha/beta hydrolase-fold protein [Chloroflexota bacterium]